MRPSLILLAEDEPVIAQDVRHQLENFGFQVIEADATAELPALCLKYRPDLVILNFRYKHSADGLSLARQLHAPSRPKVLLITGARPEELLRADDSVEVLYKPFTRRQLRESLAVLLAQKLP